MKTIILILSLILFGCTTEKKTHCNYITDYYPTVYEANLEFETGNYEKAFKLYQDVFNSCEAKNTSGLNEMSQFTESSAILQKYDVTYEYAKKEVQNGVELKRFLNNPNLEEFLLSDIGKKFLSEYDGLRKEFVANANFELRDELMSMRIADQIFRTHGVESEWPKQDSIDQLHKERLIEIFETVGYPTDKMVGPRTVENTVDVGLLLLHTKDSIRMNYFVPRVKDFVKIGTAPPTVLGRVIDQYYLYNGQPQIYGTFGAKGSYSKMIDDLKKVDSNRVSIGLPPLEMKERRDSLIQIKYGY